MWDRRKPNKPATRIGEEGVPASRVLDTAASGSAAVDINLLHFHFLHVNLNSLAKWVHLRSSLNLVLVYVSVVESPRCPVTTLAWHPHHRRTIALGKAWACSIWQQTVRLLLGVMFLTVLSSGDETGRVTVKDLGGTEPVRSEKVHSRRVNSLAYSTHR